MSTVETRVGAFVWHECLSTDVERSKSFYTQLLGWEIEVYKPGEMDYPMISKEGKTHGGFGPVPEGAPNHWVGHVLVDDADAAAERARKAGGKVVFGPEDIPDIGRFAIIMDPQGAVISAFSASGEASTPEGVFGWTAKESDMGGMTYVLFSEGETDRAGATTQMPGDPSPPHWLVYALTNDVDASTAKVKDLGGTVYMEPMSLEGVGRFSIAGDPTGAVFGLFQIPA